MKLAVEISDAADLAPKDGAGACNPFVEVEFDDQRQRTATKPADRSPYWNQTLVFDVRDPARLPSLHIDVSVLHDRRLHDHNALRPHTFLGRVRINAASVASSSADAVLQRYPLEKRGLFSRVSGDIALRLYLIQQLNDDPPPVLQPSVDNQQQHQESVAASGNPERIVRSAFAAAVAAAGGQTESVAAAAAESKGKSSHDHEPPRVVFRSVPASGGGGADHHHQQQQPQPRRATFHAVAAPPPPPGQTVVMPRPAGPAPGGPPPPGAAYGLVETKPPLPAKMGPRAAAAAAAKIASTYDMVEPMSYLYVSVVKARDLPTMDVTGALDPYVEVKLGNFKGVTKHLEKNPNPVWRQTFAFSREHLQSNQLEIVVKDKDVLKDDFVGRVLFDMSDIPHRLPPDSPLAPQWYRLADRSGDKLRHGEIMLAVWIGTQADEAFPEAWHSDAHSLPFEDLNNTRSKVYYSPKLAYLKVVAIAAQDLVPAEKGRPLAPTIAKIQMGGQVRRTRPGQPQGSANPVWNEEFMFVAGEPFEEPLVVTVEERVAAGRDEPVGRVIIPVAAPYVPRNDLAKSVEAKWFNLSRALTVEEAAAGANKDKTFASPPWFSSKSRERCRSSSSPCPATMATNGSSTAQMVGEMQSSLERVRRQLFSTSTRQLLQGPLLKRSDTLRKWNERWVILDPTTGKIEYKVRRSDSDIRGVIVFDSTSTMTLSPMNFHGLAKYDGCCFYIGTPQKKEYFLCAETPSAARAWVSTLHATQLVLQAHKEAVNSLGVNGSAKLGTVATVVAVANATAIEATKEVEAAMKISLRAALGSTANRLTKGQLDDLTIMMETLRVKDDELHQLLQDIRARDSTISEIADKLQEAAEAAETAASAAHSIDEERRFLSSELERLKQDHEKQIELSLLRLRESEDKANLLAEERDHLLVERDSALQEAQMWRSELGKARGNAVILEAAVVRAEEKARVSAADADMRIKEAVSRLKSATKEKEDLLALVDALQSQIKRQESSTIQVCEESSELCSTASKHVEDDNVDKACVSDTDPIPVTENIVELDDEGVDICTVADTEWDSPHSSEVSDVREVTTEPEENSLDIPVDT